VGGLSSEATRHGQVRAHPAPRTAADRILASRTSECAAARSTATCAIAAAAGVRKKSWKREE